MELHEKQQLTAAATDPSKFVPLTSGIPPIHTAATIAAAIAASTARPRFHSHPLSKL